MSMETKKVLEMLAAGRITTDEAEKLLEKLSANAFATGTPGAEAGASGPEGASVRQRASEIADQVRERVEKSADGKSSQQRVWGWRFSARDDAAAKLRYLRIVVDKPGDDQVNIRVPLAFMRAGMKLLGVIPPKAAEKLAEKGIDLAALRDLKGGELVDELKDLHVDVDSKNGEKVRIYCE
jgi:hypothetical protein